MSQSGWYVDPHDEAAERFYDGATWTNYTRPRSVISDVPPPPPPAPQRGRYIVVGAVLTLALVAGLIAGAALRRPSHASATPTSTASTSHASGGPTPKMSCQNSGGVPANGSDQSRVNGAGLSYSRPPAGWSPDQLNYGWLGQEQTYQKATANKPWKAFIALGTIGVADGATASFAAQQVLSCYAAGVANARPVSHVIADTNLTVSGKPAWRRDVTIPISPARDGVAAVVADVTVVNLGLPNSFSVFFAVAPQGQQDAINEIFASRTSLRAEG